VSKPTTKKTKAQSWKSKVHTSGDLAEKHVKKMFSLEEPYIEVKSARKRNWHVVVGMAQLERNAGKHYCIVVYDRGKKSDKKKSHAQPDRTIAQAFKQPLEFIFIDGVDLTRQVVKQRHQIRAIISSKRLDVRFYAYLSLRQLRELAGVSYVIDGHTVYGVPPVMPEDVIPLKPNDDIPF